MREMWYQLLYCMSFEPSKSQSLYYCKAIVSKKLNKLNCNINGADLR